MPFTLPPLWSPIREQPQTNDTEQELAEGSGQDASDRLQDSASDE